MLYTLKPEIKPKLPTFNDLQPGDVFKSPEMEGVYVKIIRIHTSFLSNGEWAMRICDGHVIEFTACEKVIPISGRFIEE
jgi:hypothetical protein